MSIEINDTCFYLTVKEHTHTERVGRRTYKYFRCECVCGKSITIRKHDIGRSYRSCGCLRKRQAKALVKTAHESCLDKIFGDFKVTKYLGKRQMPSGRWHEYEAQCIYCSKICSRLAVNLGRLGRCSCRTVKTTQKLVTSRSVKYTEHEQKLIAMNSANMQIIAIARELGIRPDTVSKAFKKIRAKATVNNTLA